MVPGRHHLEVAEGHARSAEFSRRDVLRAAGFALCGLTVGACGAANPRSVSAAPPPPVAGTAATPTAAPAVAPIARVLPGRVPETTVILGKGEFPKRLVVGPGTIIRVTNADAEMHSLVPADYEEHSVRSSDIGAGNTVHVTAPDTPGEYHFACFYHSWVAGEKGTLVVTTDPAALTAGKAEQAQQAQQIRQVEEQIRTDRAAASATPSPGASVSSSPSASPSAAGSSAGFR